MTTKSEKIAEFLKTPLTIGESVYVHRCKLEKYLTNNINKNICEIVSINGDEVTVTHSRSTYTINKNDILERFGSFYVGSNPFKTEKFDRIRVVAYTLESIVYGLGLVDGEVHRKDTYEFSGIKSKAVSWNPFVYLNTGEKKYYQRDFVWNLEDKQLLIESIYNNINCGVIIIRKRSWGELTELAKNGETEISFNDIVDGKQRLHTIKEFINDEFCDLYGNYYSDLSDSAQNKFLGHQLFQYCELPENTSDEEVLYQFLKTNFTGKPQSKDHIDYVKSLLDCYNN